VLKWATNLTEKNGPLTFNLAFNYGGRDDIMHSLRLIIAQKMSSDIITEAMIEKHLYTGGLPDVDLLFRSGGEKRISNFMLWQISSAFIYFTDTYCLILERMKLMKPLNNFTIVNLTGQTGPDPEA
jgi:undecaprenyl diphosphate synthase